MVSAVLFLSFGVSCLLDWLGKPFFVCHQHLWFALSFFATGICGLFCLSFFTTGIYVWSLSFMAFSAVGICVRLFVFAMLALVSGYQCISQFLVLCCALAARQLHPWRFELEFFSILVTLWTALQIPLWSKSHMYSAIKFTKSHSAKCSLHKWGAASKSACLNCTNLTHFCLTVGQFHRNLCIVMLWVACELCFGLLVNCYGLLQHSRLAWLELFVDHMHTHSMNNLRWQPHWLPRLISLPRKSHG